MRGSYLDHHLKMKIESILNSLGAKYEKTEDHLIKTVAEELKNKKTVGWFQGRMEFDREP